MAATAMERSNLYGLLAAVFREEPTEALLCQMRSAPIRESLSEAGVDLGPDVLKGDEGEVLERLAVEYARLFLGPGKHIAPYASVYLSGEGASLCGPAAVAVRKLIEEEGFAIASPHNLLPDHAAVELEFMQRLAEREAAASETSQPARAAGCRRAQVHFLTSHLRLWFPEFCRQVEASAELSLYREMAALARAFVESDARAMAGHSTG